MSNPSKPSTCQINKKGKKGEKKQKRQIYTYTKRAGTSGIRGQLYETKLLALIYLKALYDDDFEEFYLATNVDEIGMFDDICLRAKLKGLEKPVNIFIQAKHRENDRLLTLNNKKDLANCFDSYLRIKRRFHSGTDDFMFKGAFGDIDSIFVMYTTAKDDGSCKAWESRLASKLNSIISTGNFGAQPAYTDEDMDLLCQQVFEEQLVTLAQKLARYILEDAKSQIMDDELVLRYHFILAREVFDISDVLPEGHRLASFRKNFFCQSQKFIQIFKDAFCAEILEKRKIDLKNEVQSLLELLLSDSDDSKNVCELIRGSVITFKHGKLEFRDKMVPHDYKVKLDAISNDNSKIMDEAVELAIKECLKNSLEFKVPATFGNKDIAIRGDDVKIGKRLEHLSKKLKDLIENADGDTIIIDDSLDDGFLRLNGGIASAVGNIIVFDDTTKSFKFTENDESLGSVAKRFHKLLKSKIQNLQDYKFDMRAKVFPKLSLNKTDYDELIVKDFFSKLVFFTSQGDENVVEKKIIDEIENHEAKQETLNNPKKKSEAIFLRYHDEIQKWWMTPKEGKYLTRESDLYKKAMDSTSVVNMMPKIVFSQRVVTVENGRIVQSYDPTTRGRSESDDEE